MTSDEKMMLSGIFLVTLVAGVFAVVAIAWLLDTLGL